MSKEKENIPAGADRDQSTLTEGCSFIETDKDSLTLTCADGHEVRCSIVRIFQMPGAQYIVLIPEDGSTKGKAYLYHFALDADGAPLVTEIESDAEYERASAVFQAMTNDIDFSEEES
ncbi:MAG: DUF1292 domain-containing protein [Eubacterium sp.]|nr:DUF1292 domain-containing protein [Eubacterium sp.]